MTSKQNEQEFLPQPAVRKRYGVSGMALVRWLRRPDLGFPKPIKIGTRSFYRISELEEWEKQRATASVRENKRVRA